MLSWIVFLLFHQTIAQTLHANDDYFYIAKNTPTCLDVLQNDVITAVPSTYILQTSNSTQSQGGWTMLNARFHIANDSGVLFEAEDYNTINELGTTMNSLIWEWTTDYSNTAGAALRAKPSGNEDNAQDDYYGRMVSFKIAFSSAGDYVIWARGRSCIGCLQGVCDCTDPNKDNTAHALTYLQNGTIALVTQGEGNPIRGFDITSPYDWQWDRCNGKLFTVTAGELFPYLKTFILAVREDGFMADRLALMKNGLPDLTNAWGSTVGGAASPKVNCTANQVLYVPSTGFQGVDNVTYTVSNGLNTSTATVRLYVNTTVPSSPSPSSSVIPSATPSSIPSPSRTPSVSPSSLPSPTVSPSSHASPSVSGSSAPILSPSAAAGATPSSSPTVSPTTSASPAEGRDSASSNSTGIYVAAAVIGTAALGIGIAVGLFLKRRSNKRNDEDPDFELKRIPSDDKWSIDYKELTIGNQIGSGTFGNVFKARWRNCDCAVKQLNSSNQDSTSVAKFLKEADIVKNLRNHENVCSIFGVCTNPEYPICIVLEYVAGGSLQNLIYDRKLQMTGPLLLQFAKSICGGMSHIHQENLLHCDLACRNVLISFQGKDKYILKLTDFGLAKISDKGFYDAKEEAKFPIRWTAPEVLTTFKVSRAADVWSFGVLLWELIEAKVPWYGLNNTEVLELVCSQQQHLPKPKATFDYPADEVYAIMVQCWQQDPQARPSFDELFRKFEHLEKLWGYNQESNPHYDSTDAPSDDSGNSIGVPDYVKMRALATFSIESDCTYGNKDAN